MNRLWLISMKNVWVNSCCLTIYFICLKIFIMVKKRIMLRWADINKKEIRSCPAGAAPSKLFAYYQLTFTETDSPEAKFTHQIIPVYLHSDFKPSYDQKVELFSQSFKNKLKCQNNYMLPNNVYHFPLPK